MQYLGEFIRTKIFRWFPAIILMAVIYMASSTPSSGMPNFGWMDFVVKKGAHLFGYGLLANYYLVGIGAQTPRAAILAWVLTILYAISDEYHQTFVIGRNGTIVDVFIDAAGGGLALMLKNYRS